MPTPPAARTAGTVVTPPAPPRRPAIALRETAGGYRQHDPRETVLYGLVTEHLEPFLAEVREQHERGLPDHVEQELRAYLECGIHAFGFGRARCRDCGRELVVAFSCYPERETIRSRAPWDRISSLGARDLLRIVSAR